jgi:hypothetical protein
MVQGERANNWIIELAVDMLEHYREHYLIKPVSQVNSPHPSQVIQHTNGY